jgi:hypothetical protein
MVYVEIMLDIEPIPTPKDEDHPLPRYKVLPKHEFTMCLVAPKGSGKTTLILNLLKFYKGYFHNIIIFSPTIYNDSKWDWARKQKILGENKKLKRYLKRRKSKEDTIVSQRPLDVEFDLLVGPNDPEKHMKGEEDKFTGKIPEQNFITHYDENTLMDIIGEQQRVVEMLKEDGKSRHMADRILLLFDDLVGSALFSRRQDSPFTILNTTHRHKSASIIMVTQAYREIPKTIRTNYSCLILFFIANEKEIEAIMEEYPFSMKKEQWLQVYNYCVAEPYSFMFCNLLEDGKSTVMKKFNQKVYLKPVTQEVQS